MKTAVDWLVDHLYLVIPYEERNFLEGLRKEALEKEKEQAIGLIDQTAMFMSVVTQDEDVAKMDFEDVYNSYYNQNK